MEAQDPRGDRASTIIKYYLLDTCVLGKVFNNKVSVISETESLQSIGASFCINEPIKFEFLKPATELDYIVSRERLIAEYSATILTLDPEIRRDAITISKIYNFHGIPTKQISYVDILNAGYLKKFSSNLILMTFDGQDYPPCLFDQIEFKALEETKSREILGYYRFNIEKYRRSCERFCL